MKISKKQIDITLVDIFPESSSEARQATLAELGSDVLLVPLKQYKYIFKQQSRPLTCPICYEAHTWNEIILNDKKCREYELEHVLPMGSIPYLAPTEESIKKLRSKR